MGAEGRREDAAEIHTIRPCSSDIAVELQSDHRRKGLLWYSTFKVAFRGIMCFTNPEKEQADAVVDAAFAGGAGGL